MCCVDVWINISAKVEVTSDSQESQSDQAPQLMPIDRRLLSEILSAKRSITTSKRHG